MTRPLSRARVPETPGAWYSLLADLYRGLPVFDEHGEPTGEYQEVITREQFLRLMDMPAHLDATPGER